MSNFKKKVHYPLPFTYIRMRVLRFLWKDGPVETHSCTEINEKYDPMIEQQLFRVRGFPKEK